MFPTRLFPDRLFAPRYFPKIGEDAVDPGTLPTHRYAPPLRATRRKSPFTRWNWMKGEKGFR